MIKELKTIYRNKQVLIVPMLCGFFFVLPCYAQSGQVNGFFPQNFADSPVKGEDQDKRNRDLQRSSPNQIMAPRGNQDAQNFFGPANTEEIKQPEASVGNLDEVKSEEEPRAEPIPVINIGALINCTDSQHMKQSFKEFAETVVDKDLAVGRMFTIGLPAEDSSAFQKQGFNDMVMPLLVRGGSIEMRGWVPPRYRAAKNSPTWVVETEKGVYLLEGVRPLRAFFNQKGEFVDRSEMDVMSKYTVVSDKTDELPLPEGLMMVKGEELSAEDEAVSRAQLKESKDKLGEFIEQANMSDQKELYEFKASLAKSQAGQTAE